jgi:hypothetical protein
VQLGEFYGISSKEETQKNGKKETQKTFEKDSYSASKQEVN